MPAPRPRSARRKVAIALAWVFGILLLPSPLIIRAFVAQQFNMPSGSMMPTLPRRS